MLKILKKCLSMFKKRWKLLLILLVVIVILVAWLSGKQKNSQAALVFVKPEYKTLTKTLEISGVVDAKEKARLRFLTGGKLTYVGVKEGDRVKKWQTVAIIDQASLKKQLDQYLNLYLKERSDYEQFRDDNIEDGNGVTQVVPELSTRRESDKAQWDLENTVLSVEIQDIAVKNAVLSSPINGIVTVAPMALAGMQLLATDYFEIVNPDTLVFKAIVDEVDIATVKTDQVAEIDLDAYPDQLIATHVSYIAFSSQQTSTGTVFLIELPLTNQPEATKLRIGMNGNATLTIDQKDNVLALPLATTREKDGKTLVDVKTTDGKYEEREIEVGLETDEEVEVIKGLSTQDEVLLPS